MECKHEPLIGIDNLIRCRSCGQILPYAEQQLAKVSSARMANRVLDEIAIKGGFHAESFDGNFIVYSKDKNGIREEVTATKKSDRVYVIMQKFIIKA